MEDIITCFSCRLLSRHGNDNGIKKCLMPPILLLLKVFEKYTVVWRVFSMTSQAQRLKDDEEMLMHNQWQLEELENHRREIEKQRKKVEFGWVNVK